MEAMKAGFKRGQAGFTQRFLARIVLVLLLAFTVGIYVKVVKHRGELSMCMFNLGQIEQATEHAAQDGSIPFGETPTLQAVHGYITGSPPSCPSGGIYTYPPVGGRASCTAHGTIASSSSE